MNCPDYFPQITQMDTDFIFEHESIEYNESFLCPTGRNPLKIFIIILGSLSQK